MPVFENVEIEISQKIDIDFEVYCGTCGSGLCSESETRRSRGRGHLQVTVNACHNCMEGKDSEIKDLKDEIESLSEEIEELKNKLNTT